MDEPLLVEIEDGVGVLTLNRPDALNALNAALRAALVANLAALDARDDIGAIVLTGRGRAFCAGLDVKELASSSDSVADNIGEADIGAAIGALRTPLIAAINGLAVTGGFEITLACDIVIAARSAWFRDTHVEIGLLPGWGLSQRLSRVIGPYRAKEISLTGRKVAAEEAAALGFVNRVVEYEALRAEAVAMARSIASFSKAHVARIKKLVDTGYRLPFGEALEHEVVQALALNREVAISAERRAEPAPNTGDRS